ncbi:MAG: class I SAM-dependent methyltransferase [Nitrospinaceae bacterium]
MAEINLLATHPPAKRNYDARLADKTPAVIRVARQFGREFFDGERKFGYGGYQYDGRWQAVVECMRRHFNLAEDASILDVGCGKGFLLHDFREAMPGCTIAGVDVSEYAIKNAMESVKPCLKIGSAETLDFPDNSFDLVVSINSIHNLPLEPCVRAIKEIQRVSRQHSYITIDAWRNEQERENLMKWILTAETFMHVDDWIKLFQEIGYTGDYWWFIAE